jgi:hypothetical protein
MMHKKIVGEFQPISLNRDQSDCLTDENTKECAVDTLQSVGLRMHPPSTERTRLRSAFTQSMVPLVDPAPMRVPPTTLTRCRAGCLSRAQRRSKNNQFGVAAWRIAPPVCLGLLDRRRDQRISFEGITVGYAAFLRNRHQLRARYRRTSMNGVTAATRAAVFCCREQMEASQVKL